MLEIKFVIQNLSLVQKVLSLRGETADLKNLASCDVKRREILLEIEALRHRRNKVSEQIAIMKKEGEDTKNFVNEMRKVSGRIKNLEKFLTEMEEKVNNILIGLPNIPHTSVPAGKDSSENNYRLSDNSLHKARRKNLSKSCRCVRH